MPPAVQLFFLDLEFYLDLVLNVDFLASGRLAM
jgi:hypothetical protein